MKWRAHRNEKGEVDQNVVVSDPPTHTILRVTSSLFIVFRKTKPQAVIIGRYSTAATARACCEADYEGRAFPPDTSETYPPGYPTLDTPREGPPGTDPSSGAVSGDEAVSGTSI